MKDYTLTRTAGGETSAQLQREMRKKTRKTLVMVLMGIFAAMLYLFGIQTGLMVEAMMGGAFVRLVMYFVWDVPVVVQKAVGR